MPAAPHPMVPQRGVALLLSADGRVQEVLRDELGLSHRMASLKQPVRFHHLFLEDSRKKAAMFVGNIRQQGAAFEWEMALPVFASPLEGALQERAPQERALHGGTQEMALVHFAGGMVGRQICILGATMQEEVSRFFEEFLELTSEQAELLRAAVRKGMPISASPSRSMGLYEDFSRLNNELVNAQRALHKNNAELTRLNAEKSMMVGMAAHDLRNPLGVIMTYSEVLGEELEALQVQLADVAGVDPGLIDMCQSIHRSSGFMLALVEQLLDLSKIESGTMELERTIVDFEQFVAENVHLNRVLARAKHVGIEFVVEPGLPSIPADAHKMTQVLNNLITNAVKFSPLRGDVIVTLQQRDGWLTVGVADRGPGIPEDKREAIFQPFAQLKGQEKSAGLGLAIARKIVRAHDGDILVEENPGGGARFVVRLPLPSPQPIPRPKTRPILEQALKPASLPEDAHTQNAAGSQPRAQAAEDARTKEAPAAQAEAAPGASGPPGVLHPPDASGPPGAPASPDPLEGMVLVVADDDTVSRIMQVRVLEAAGAEVHQANGGEALLELLSTIAAHAVLCDVHMPDVDGLAVLRRIRNGEVAGVPPGIPILAVTGEADVSLEVAPGVAFTGVLRKPVVRENLLRTVAALR